MAASISDVLPVGGTLVYCCRLNGTDYARHWAIRQPAPGSGGEHITFLSETDLAAVGLGPPLARVRADLLCAADLRPRHYRLATEMTVIEVAFGDGVTLHFADGTNHHLAEAGIQALAGDNLAQLALLLRLHISALHTAWHTKLFSVSAAAGFGYTVTPASGARRFTSSFHEEFSLDAEGWLDQHAVPMAGSTSVRIDAPLPAWIDTPLAPGQPLPVYQPPAKRTFTIEDAAIPGPSVPLGATLTIPPGPGPHPVVLFIGGSGTHDRHGFSGLVDLGSHEIVDALTEGGWLGVRFDTRGAGSTPLGADFLAAGMIESVDDARAVLRHVLQDARASPDICVLVGHSQGGVIALELAVEFPSVRGVVLLASTGRPISEVIADQLRNKAAVLGLDDAQLAAQLDEQEAFTRLVQSEGDWDAEHIPERFWSARRSRPWYAQHLARDPRRLIARMRCPVLICQGEADFQVLADRDAAALAAAARDAGVPHRLHIFSGLDHLFKPTKGPSSLNDYYTDRRVSPELLTVLAGFLDSVKA